MIKACLSNDFSNSKDKILTISDDKQALLSYRIDENGRRVLCNTRTSCRIRQDFPLIAQNARVNITDAEKMAFAKKVLNLHLRMICLLCNKP